LAKAERRVDKLLSKLFEALDGVEKSAKGMLKFEGAPKPTPVLRPRPLSELKR